MFARSYVGRCGKCRFRCSYISQSSQTENCGSLAILVLPRRVATRWRAAIVDAAGDAIMIMHEARPCHRVPSAASPPSHLWFPCAELCLSYLVIMNHRCCWWLPKNKTKQLQQFNRRHQNYHYHCAVWRDCNLCRIAHIGCGHRHTVDCPRRCVDCWVHRAFCCAISIHRHWSLSRRRSWRIFDFVECPLCKKVQTIFEPPLFVVSVDF